MKILLWLYAVAGTIYFMMYAMGDEIVARHAVGPFWLAMMAAPGVAGLLLMWPLIKRIAGEYLYIGKRRC